MKHLSHKEKIASSILAVPTQVFCKRKTDFILVCVNMLCVQNLSLSPYLSNELGKIVPLIQLLEFHVLPSDKLRVA